MSDLEPNDSYSTSTLAKRGLAAIGCTAGAAFLLVLQAVARARVLGLAVGAIACVVGIVSLMSKDPTDRRVGWVVTGAGVLVVLSKTGIPFLQVAAGTLLSIGVVGLLAMGVLNGLRFFRGLKQRS